MASIAFSYVDPATGREIVDTWQGDRAEAIAAAQRRLDAVNYVAKPKSRKAVR